jgi:hypothetical protein
MSKRRAVAKWHVLVLIGIILLGYAAYAAYYTPEVSFTEVTSYLTGLQKANQLNLASGNFSTVSGRSTLTITPVGGFATNATLTILTDDPGATIEAYSSAPLTLISGGTQNATYMLPITNNELTLDVLFTFSNSSLTYQVTYEVAAIGVTNSTTVYANP